MKVLQEWKRNASSDCCGESMTVTFTYYSADKNEMDVLEGLMPKHHVVTEVEGNKLKKYFEELRMIEN